MKKPSLSITYSTRKDLPCLPLAALFRAVGWSDGSETEEMLAHFNRPFLNSTFVCSAWDGEKLIGCVRALSDKLFRSVIYDLAVLPEYQGHGIGSELVRRIRSECPDSEWLLETIPERVSFYEKLGFSQFIQPVIHLPCKWFK